MKQKWSPQPTAIPTKNRFEALQAQDPSSSQLQETIIENIKKKKKWYTKEKSKQTAYAPGHVTSNQEQKQWRSDKHLPRRSDEKSNTTNPKALHYLQRHWRVRRIRACPSATPLKTTRTPPHWQKGPAPPPPNQHNPPGPKRHDRPHSLKIRNFHIKRIHSGKHVLYLQRRNDYAKAKNILTATNTAYYTYTPKSQKPHTYLLKGLGNSFTEAEILEDLKALKIEEVNFTKVSRFTTRKSRENNILLPIYIIQVSPDSNIGTLLKINRLNYLKIAWEKIKKNDITQCYKCQRIGHTAQNCNLKYRYVKCTEPHGPGECKIKKEVAVCKEKIYCVNCKNFGHPASYKGCPKLAELRKKLNEKNHQSEKNKNRTDRPNKL